MHTLIECLYVNNNLNKKVEINVVYSAQTDEAADKLPTDENEERDSLPLGDKQQEQDAAR